MESNKLDQQKIKARGWHDTGQGFTELTGGTREHVPVVTVE